eukprot:m.385749 g.385749  ORF g.385749 m.385749 type:complete len:369 (-) comp28278_c0_seq2:692-1798(-)
MTEEPEEGIRLLLFVVLSLFVGVFFKGLAQFIPFTLPYTAMLFLVGWGWGALTNAGELTESAGLMIQIEPGLLLLAFLPALVFVSAFETNWYMFHQSLNQIALLAVVGLVIVTVLGACVIKGILEPEWDWARALLMASILSATDPVAVVALMRANSAPTQIITLMEGESLLNDEFWGDGGHAAAALGRRHAPRDCLGDRRHLAPRAGAEQLDRGAAAAPHHVVPAVLHGRGAVPRVEHPRRRGLRAVLSVVWQVEDLARYDARRAHLPRERRVYQRDGHLCALRRHHRDGRAEDRPDAGRLGQGRRALVLRDGDPWPDVPGPLAAAEPLRQRVWHEARRRHDLGWPEGGRLACAGAGRPTARPRGGLW